MPLMPPQQNLLLMMPLHTPNLLFGPFKMLQNHHFDPTSTCLFRQLYHLFHAISSRRDALCEKQNCIL